MKRLLLVVLTAAALVGAACGSDASEPSASGSSGKTQTVTLVLDWTPNTNHSGFYLAKAKGWYAEAGLDVKIVEPGESTTSLNQLAAGNAEFAVGVAESLLPARAAGAPVVSLGAIIQHNTSSLLSLSSDNITRPADLAGKTYGGFGGELETALVKQLVACDGGDPEQVRFVEVGNVDYRVGLERDDYDFVWIFDGWDLVRLRDLEKLAVATIPFRQWTRCIPDWYTPLVATNEKTIGAAPETVRAFMAATARGYAAAAADPGAAADALLAAAPELDRDLVTRSAAYLAGKYAEGAPAWGVQDRAVWARFEEFLRASGLLDSPVAVDKAFTNDFLPKQ
ncbi:MAG: ABC transporter substrate-binding protein [Acidimicrobiales bacterium]